MMRAALGLAGMPALVAVAAVGLALLPLVALLWRLDKSRAAGDSSG